MERTCRCLPKGSVREKRGPLSSFNILLIALIPKCPFCVLTYSSTITMCGATSMESSFTHWALWISIGLALLTLTSVLINFKGRKTIISAALILLASSMLVYTQLVEWNNLIYYLGCSVLFLGAWINGSFLHFQKKYFGPLWRKLSASVLRRGQLHAE